MSEHSPITRRYLRSNVNSFGNSRNRNGHPSINLEKPMARTVVNSVDNTPKNAPQRATHTRGSLLNFKAVLNVEDVDAAMVKRMSLGGGVNDGEREYNTRVHVHTCMCMCIHACACACVHECMSACVHECMGAWVHGCVAA